MGIDLAFLAVSAIDSAISVVQTVRGLVTDDGDDDEDDLEGGMEVIDWGKTDRAKQWDRVNQPYHPGDRRRRR